mmetsp:Transcript_4871/g.10763  ORF Transcript_4871/g.10763 Transcript_4871/m.10763 type:complete len:269 (-) Transcript_4871:30-836(-)
MTIPQHFNLRHFPSLPKCLSNFHPPPLHRHSRNLLDPAAHAQIQKLVPDLNLQSPQNGGIHLAAQHHLGPLGKLPLHGIGHGLCLRLGQRLGRNDGRLHLPPLGLHELDVVVHDGVDGGQTRVARQSRHEIHRDGGEFVAQHFLDLLRLGVARDERVFEEGLEGGGGGGGGADGEELGFHGGEGGGFGGGDVCGVGVAGGEAVEVEGGFVGVGGGGHGAGGLGEGGGGAAEGFGGGVGEHGAFFFGCWLALNRWVAVVVCFWLEIHKN